MISILALGELLEQVSGAGLDATDLKVTTDQLQKDLADLESKVGAAKLTTYGTELASLRNDLDHLVGKRKGIDKTYEKTEDGKRGIFGQRQERMKRRNANNIQDLTSIEQRFVALDNKLYKEAGIVSERRMRMLIEQQTRSLAASGAIITDANGNPTGIDASKLSKAQGVLEANLRAGQDLWKGDMTAEKLVDAGGEGVIGGAMANVGYEGKNIKTTITIAKVLVGLMIFNYYRNNTNGLGEKLARGAVLYGLLSSNALGGWDIFWKGGQNGVLNTSQFFKGSGDFASYSPEMQKKYDLLSKGKDKVQGLKDLFVPDKKDNLKQYLKFDGTSWIFDNNAFLTDYNLRNISPAASPITAVGAELTKAKPLTDLNEAEAGGVIASLIQADKYDGGAELNRQLNAYLGAAGITDVDAVVKISVEELDTKLATATADLKKAAEAENTALETEINTRLKKNYPGHVVIEGAAQNAKDVIAKGQAIPTTVAELQSKKLIREVAKGDALVIDDAETKALVASLMALPEPFVEAEANALVIAFNEMKAEFPRSMSSAELKIVDGQLYYQNNGRKIPLVGRSQATGLGFDFNKAGIKGASRNASTGFKETLVFADAITKIWSVAAGRVDDWSKTTVDTERSTQPQGGVNYNQVASETGASVGMNTFPWKRSEGALFGVGSGLSIRSQRGLFNFSDDISYVNTMLGEALSRSEGKDIILHNFATLLNSMKMEDGTTSIWIEGKGKLPDGTLAVDGKGASIAQGVSLEVKYDEVTSLSQLAKKMNDAMVGGTKLIRGDVINGLTGIGGDLKEILKAAVPATGEVVKVMYDETTKGIKTVYEDVAGSFETDAEGRTIYEYNDGAGNYQTTTDATRGERDKTITNFKPKIKKSGAIRTVYNDGTTAVRVIGPDLKKSLSWVVKTGGELTNETVDQIVGVLDNMMKPENKEKLERFIGNVADLATKTLDEVVELVSKGIADVLKIPTQTYDHMTMREIVVDLLLVFGWKVGRGRSEAGNTAP